MFAIRFRALPSIAAFLLSTSLLTTQVWAAPPVIVSSSADTVAGTVTIKGNHLAAGAASVLLGSFGPLSVISQVPTKLVVALPPTIAAGSHTLSVQIGANIDESVLTIGAVGPAGPQGPIGLSGPAGASGATGPVGATGTAGATGLQGIAGTAGAVGPAGATGAAGSPGATGPQGSAGPAGPTGATGPQGLPGPDNVAGNITLADSTETAGNIVKNGSTFLHNFGSDNTFAGKNAGNLSMSGDSNSGFGAGALNSNTSGSRQTAIGFESLFGNTDGFSNTAVGHRTMSGNSSGYANTAVGSHALFRNSEGAMNVAIGEQTLVNNTTGANNIAVGALSMLYGTTASYNTALGYSTLYNITTGFDNIAIGQHAMRENLDGSGNTAVGGTALINNTAGHYNIAVGSGALTYNTTGTSNTATGYRSLLSNTTGEYNTAIGFHSLYSLASGSNNTALGKFAGYGVVDGHQNIHIAAWGSANDSEMIRIGTQGLHAATFVAGIYGATTGGVGVPVLIDANGQLGTFSSSRRFKEDIVSMDTSTSSLMQLRPVTFHYKSDHNRPKRQLQYGLIAEEVAAHFPELVARGPDGQIDTVLYQFLPPMLLNEFQRQQQTLVAQSKEIEVLRYQVDQLMRHNIAQAERLRNLDGIVSDVSQLMGRLAQIRTTSRAGGRRPAVLTAASRRD